MRVTESICHSQTAPTRKEVESFVLENDFGGNVDWLRNGESDETMSKNMRAGRVASSTGSMSYGGPASPEQKSTKGKVRRRSVRLAGSKTERGDLLDNVCGLGGGVSGSVNKGTKGPRSSRGKGEGPPIREQDLAGEQHLDPMSLWGLDIGGNYEIVHPGLAAAARAVGAPVKGGCGSTQEQRVPLQGGLRSRGVKQDGCESEEYNELCQLRRESMANAKRTRVTWGVVGALAAGVLLLLVVVLSDRGRGASDLWATLFGGRSFGGHGLEDEGEDAYY